MVTVTAATTFVDDDDDGDVGNEDDSVQISIEFFTQTLTCKEVRREIQTRHPLEESLLPSRQARVDSNQ